MDTTQVQPARGRGAKLAVTGVALGLIGVLGGAATWSAFQETTQNPDNTFEVGDVTITDDDTDVSMFSVSNMAPGDTVTRCIKVHYTGSVPAQVRLYADLGAGSALDQHLDVTVKRGGATGTFPGCGTFADDTSLVQTATLAGFPADYATGAAGTDPGWAPGDEHVYQFTVSLNESVRAETGVTSTDAIAFIWEARDA